MHRNARLTHWGRQELARRIEAGTPVGDRGAADERVSRRPSTSGGAAAQADPTASGGWTARAGRTGPERGPAARSNAKILEPAAQQEARPGPHRRVASACRPRRCIAVLVRNRSAPAGVDGPADRAGSIRRYEHDRPGDLVHVDIKKLGKVPPGGGWRVHGRGRLRHQCHERTAASATRYVHSAVDDHSRLAYSEIHDDERKPRPPSGSGSELGRSSPTTASPCNEVLTDNGCCYRSSRLASRSSSPAASATAAPGPTDPRPTARSNASTAPCSRNGPTSAPTAQKPNDGDASTAGCTPTTITAATPPSAANPPITRVNNLPGHYN